MSTKKDNGGPAFPGNGEQFVEGAHGIMPQSAYGMQGHEGMSLRDYFAAKAMQSLIDKYPRITVPEDEPEMGPQETKARNLMESICEGAYGYADAMLNAREK